MEVSANVKVSVDLPTPGDDAIANMALFEMQRRAWEMLGPLVMLPWWEMTNESPIGEGQERITEPYTNHVWVYALSITPAQYAWELEENPDMAKTMWIPYGGLYWAIYSNSNDSGVGDCPCYLEDNGQVEVYI